MYLNIRTAKHHFESDVFSLIHFELSRKLKGLFKKQDKSNREEGVIEIKLTKVNHIQGNSMMKAETVQFSATGCTMEP